MAPAGVDRDTQIIPNDEFAGLLLHETEVEDFQQLVLQLLHQTEDDESIRADSLELPITSTSHDNVDLYADELEQFLLLHQENQEIPEALTSAGPLGASNINKCVRIKIVNMFLKCLCMIQLQRVPQNLPSHLSA